MTEVVAKKTGMQLIIIFGVMLMNLIIQFNIWISLRYDNSTIGADEENILLKSLLSQAFIIPGLILLTFILVSLAYNNKITYFSEPGSAMLNISLLLALLVCIGSGSVTGYLAYKLQCVELQKTLWLNLLFATMLSLGTAIFIILVQISDRAGSFTSGLRSETSTAQALEAVEEATKPSESLQRLQSIAGVGDRDLAQRVLQESKMQEQQRRAIKESVLTGGAGLTSQQQQQYIGNPYGGGVSRDPYAYGGRGQYY